MKKSLPIFMLFFALPIKTMDNDLNQQLCCAVSHANPNREQIHSLIAAKADVNYSFTSNRSLLHWAASWGYQKSCMILLELGANPNTNAQLSGIYMVNPTPLMAAIDKKLTEISCLMIEKGADIHVQDSNDRNALWMACDKNLPEVGKFLIEKQADINIQNKTGQTPLMLSVLQRNIPLCKLLLSGGASLRFRMQSGETALIIAAKRNVRDLILAMLNHVIFPSKTEAKFLMYSLFRLRTTNQIAKELYRHQAKSLLAPWLLLDVAAKNKQACIELLEMRDTHSNRRAFECYTVSLLNPEFIDATIESLIQNQLGNIDL